MKITPLASFAFLGIGIAGCSKPPASVVAEQRLSEEISGVGSSEMQPQELADGLFFSVISKRPSNTLHWKLTKGTSSTMAGQGALAGEKYAYHWDREKKIFRFATARNIDWMDVSEWTFATLQSKHSGIKSIEGFESDADLPPKFRDSIRLILK
jgi:hypothetical protein